MLQLPRYETDPDLKKLETRVTEVGKDSIGEWVQLEETLFYPEGGGQPADHGKIGEARVFNVLKGPEGPRHYFLGKLEPGPVQIELDWIRRFDHMQQHTAQHLITALAADRFGWATTSFHLGSEQSDIELEVETISDSDLCALEELVAEAVRSALPVTSRRVSPEEFEKLQVRTRGLPKDHQGSIRLVQIQGIDLNTCGGTHVASTASLEGVKLMGTESVRGQTRVYYLAGKRLRQRLGVQETILAQLRGVLDTGNEGLKEAAERVLEQHREASRAIRALEGELVAAVVDSLLGTSGRVLSHHYEGRSLPFLQQIARQVLNQDPGRILLLTTAAAGSREGLFVLAAGSESELSLQEAGDQIARILEGRGGGQPPIFQGKATRLDRRAEALEFLVP